LGWYPVLDFKQAIKLAIEEYKVDGMSSEEIFNQRIEHINKYIELRRKIENEM
jgi:CDP-glucose 4,6-dehydratase